MNFYNLTRSTLIAVYILILVGGVVRSTGSGMGCPDWPKCFGRWTPPTSVEELPSNYKDIYSEYRQKKNERFAKYLRAFGFSDIATKILSDESIKTEPEFNPLKTWIEYVNRIVGVVIGFLIFLVFVSSIRYWNSNRKLTVIAFFTFVLVGFQGWIGSVVVSTNLTPWTITFHMFLAIVIVFMLIYLLFNNQKDEWGSFVGARSIRNLLLISLVTILIQILLGTQVRESIDRIASINLDRMSWISELGMEFIIHRSFSWIVLLINSILVIKLWKMDSKNRFPLTLILLILGTLLTGVSMAWFGIPAFLQPVHLVLATITIGVEFFLVLQVGNRVKGMNKV